jgi:hypothetical protein
MTDEKKSLYIETTIPSYATSRESINLVVAARQFLTKQFLEQERDNYQLYTSQYVIDECKLGDPEAAKRRLNFMAGIVVLPPTDEIAELAYVYFNILQIPDRAKIDCFHLATCVIAKIDYLLSWNCVHLGFTSYVKAVGYNSKHGLWTPLLVTPDYLLNLVYDDEERI